VYTRHFYQWQESTDNETWNNINGETAESLTTPPLISSRYFRVKVAEDEVNLNNNLCSSASEAFFIKIISTPEAPRSLGNISICSNEEPQALWVEAKPDETVNWYDAPQGGNLLAVGSTSFLPPASGTFYADAVKNDFSCAPGPRTSVSLEIYEVPAISDEVLQLCPDTALELDAGVEVMQYLWNTGENTRKVNTSVPGTFSVSLTTQNGCIVVKNFEVNAVEEALIEGINSEENTVIINTINPGEFEYSLDGINFQLSNLFEMVPGGIYTGYVRDFQQCFTATLEFPHIVVPKFITPNNDGYNDHFQLNGVSWFEASEIRIFDRYGKLILSGKGANFKWDGTLNGKQLPASAYWYWIFIEGFEPIKGNFSLMR
ncbi:MAG: T9SS type B sorting domain-containing protein, partial [Gillisia sp.]